MSNVLRACLFFSVFWTLHHSFAFTQSLTPEELEYRQLMESILERDLTDSVAIDMAMDSLLNVSYYNSQLPFQYSHRIIEMLEKTGDHVSLGRFEHLLGTMYINTGKLELALHHAKKAVTYFAESNQRKSEAASHGLLRYLYSISAAHDSSLYHCYAALNIYQELNDKVGIGATYNDIAGTIMGTGNYEEALVFVEKGIPLLENSDDLFEHLMIKDKKATILSELGNTEGAIDVISEIIALADTLDPGISNVTAAGFFHARARFYTISQQYDEALQDVRSASLYLRSVNSPYWQQVTDMSMARIYKKQGNFEAAKNMYLSMLDMPGVDSTAYAGNWEVSASELAEIYHHKGMKDSAFYYLTQSNHFSHKKVAAESGRQMEALKTQYETEQKEQLIAAQESRIRQQKNVQFLSWVLSATLILGLVSVGWFFMANKRKTKELQIVNRKLDKRNEQNEVLLKEIHHRVKNNLQIVSSLLNLQSQSIHDHAALDAVGDSQHRVRSMALIHQKLYLNKNLASIEMLDYFETMGEAILQSFGSRAALINYKVEMERLELDIDTAIPLGLITNELVTNSLKHAFPDGRKGSVIVGLSKIEDDELVLTVTDDGVSDTDGSSPSGPGFGTQLIQLLALQLDGRVVRSFQNGTRVALHFPSTALLEG